MGNKPKIIIGETRKKTALEKEFNFTRESIRFIPGFEFLNQYREKAYDIFQSTPMPNTRQEAWRRTDIRQLNPAHFQLSSNNGHADKVLEALHEETNEFVGSILVTPETSQIRIDPVLREKGVIFTDLLTAEQEYPDLLEKAIGRLIKPEEGKFAALAAAFSQNGVFVYVPKNVVLENPLQSLFTISDSDRAFVTHYVILVDSGASVTIFHELASTLSEAGNFHAGLVEVNVAENASLQFVEIQAWDHGMWNFTHERVHVNKSARLDWIVGALGSKLTKSFVDLDLVGEGAVGKLSGFSFTNRDQHLDYDTQQNHMVPHTTSDLLYKVALTDQSRSVWQGMIYVAPGAEKTDGYQSNKNLLLSPAARADSIPGLEILADDVRCTHGATIGELDFDQVFYMMSRGIPRQEAEKLLVEGFFDPIMQRIPFESVRNRFFQSITHKLNLT